MARHTKHPPARIAVMLVNLESDRATLETLSLLAGESPAEIHGLFVEDIELLSLAGLPLAREYCRLTHVERVVQAPELERQFRIQARAAEQALTALASRCGLHCSFRTVRGEPATLLRETLEAMDLMLLGATRNTLSVADYRAAAPRGRSIKRPVTVVFDGSETAQRALGVGAQLARTGAGTLTVLLVAESSAALDTLRAQVAKRLGPQPAAFREALKPDMSELIRQVQSSRAGCLVIGWNEDLLIPDNIERLRRQPGCPVVLVS
jgi:nucleotide-binding universal stress UspA family protein